MHAWCLLESHRSLRLYSFFPSFFLCASIWIISIDLSSGLLILSPAMSNILFRYLMIFFSFWTVYFSVLEFHSGSYLLCWYTLSFHSLWPFFSFKSVITFKFLSANLIIFVILRSLSSKYFLSRLWFTFSYFFTCLVIIYLCAELCMWYCIGHLDFVVFL